MLLLSIHYVSKQWIMEPQWSPYPFSTCCSGYQFQSNEGMPLLSAAQLSGTPARSPRASDLLVINTIILCRLYIIIIYIIIIMDNYVTSAPVTITDICSSGHYHCSGTRGAGLGGSQELLPLHALYDAVNGLKKDGHDTPKSVRITCLKRMPINISCILHKLISHYTVKEYSNIEFNSAYKVGKLCSAWNNLQKGKRSRI